MAINILETDNDKVYSIEGQYDINHFDLMVNGKWGDDMEDSNGDPFVWEGEVQSNNPFDSMLRGYAESICHNLTDELRELIDSHQYEQVMEELGIKSMMMGYNDMSGDSIAFTDYCFNVDLSKTHFLLAQNVDSKICKEPSIDKGIAIEDIVDFMSIGVDRTEEEKEKIQNRLMSIIEEEYKGAPIEEVFDVVKSAPFIFSKKLGIVGPLNDYRDYMYNGDKEIHIEDLNIDKNLGFGLERLKIDKCMSGLVTVQYESTRKDGTPFRAQESAYYNGTLLGEFKLLGLGGEKKRQATVYTNNPLADLYTDYISKMNNVTLEKSDSVIKQPSYEDLIADFRETYSRPNMKEEFTNYLKEKPDYVMFDANDKPFITIEANYINDVIDEEMPKLFANNPHGLMVMDFVDRRSIIDDAMRILDTGGLENYLDNEESFEPMLSDKDIREATDRYISNLLVYPLLEETERLILPHLTENMEACYDAERAERVQYLKEGYNPIYLTPAPNLTERYAAVNQGFYYMGNDADYYVNNARKLEYMRDLVNHTKKAFDDLERKAVVSKQLYSNMSADEIVVETLIGTEKKNDTIKDTIKDYQNFRDKFLPSLEKATNVKGNENLPDKVRRMEEVKRVSEVFTSGKMLFKTDFFKEPCKMFCDAVVDRMNHNEEFKSFIKTGKISAQANSFQK